MKLILITLFGLGISFKVFASSVSDVSFEDIKPMIGTYESNKDSNLFVKISYQNNQLFFETNESWLPRCEDVRYEQPTSINPHFKYIFGSAEYIYVNIPIDSSCTAWNFHPALTLMYNKSTKALSVERRVIKNSKEYYQQVSED